ncbi:hypothetical protein OBBRIDRAFT_801519 [Obba rivulosa]|uniref:Protein-S-isoprenylcysteine O-methyltransferase n=1 Tax=Obba rivulosa TaxID=1052685 RepID=A0A8E2DQW4_9APHY|nr:hypothetical protein OBBRIDRAFT_801519 [Obba rivulosa]
MSLLKIPFLISAPLAIHITLMPPRPSPAANEIVKDVSSAERVFPMTARFLIAFANIIIWISSFFEIVVIAACNVPSRPITEKISRVLTWDPTRPSKTIYITPIFTIGWTLVIIGSILRLQCYRTMGRLFTYQITLRSGHKLVTHGPYSIVRYPSYTVFYILTTGMAICQCSPGSWVRESGLFSTEWGKVIALGWLTEMVYLGVMTWLRTAQEDRILRRKFGEAWDK